MLNSGTYMDYHHAHTTQGLPCQTRTAYHAMEQWVLKVTEQVMQEGCQQAMISYQETHPEEGMVWSSDCRWSHQHNTSQATYSCINTATQQVMHQVMLTKAHVHLLKGQEVVVSPGNYFGTTKGMEGEGFHQLIDWLEGEGLLPYLHEFVCDQDSSVV